MKKQWIVLVLVATLLAAFVAAPSPAQDKPAPTTAPAAATQPAKVAVCDLLAVLRNADHGNDCKKELQDRIKRISAESDKRGEEIKKIEDGLELLKQGSKEYDAQLNKMTELSIQRQAYINLQDELAKRDTYRNTKMLYQEALDAVEKVAKEKGYQLVLFKESPNLVTTKYDELLEQMARRKVLFADSSLDITDDVLKQLNRDYALKKK